METEREAAALRAMLELLDQIEALMNEAAYSETAERKVTALRAQWIRELAAAESTLVSRWIA